MATLNYRKRAVSGDASPAPVNNQAKAHDRHKHASLTLRLRATGFKPHPNPYKGSDDKAEQYSFKLLANRELPEALGPEFFERWMKVNPREQNLTGPIMKGIEDTWHESPTEFFRANRGIVICAEAVTFDNETGTVELLFTDPRKHGGVDGGHTLKKIVKDLIPSTYGPIPNGGEADTSDDDDGSDEQNDSDNPNHAEAEEIVDRYFNVEVWVGLSLEQVALLSQARNTSRTVPPYAIEAMKGNYDSLKAAIAACNPVYADKIIAVKPNEHVEGLDEFKPVSILEPLQLMMALDITHFDANNHPVEAYKNKAFAAKYYSERPEEYEKMFPLVGDFLELYDKLRQLVPSAYDDAKSRPRRWSKVLAGPGEPVDTREVEPLYYLDPTGKTKTLRSPNAVFFPMYSAFRAYLHEVSGQYQWMGKSPLQWKQAEFQGACQRLSLKMAKAIRDKDKLNAVGRDPQVWDTCYEALNGYLFEIGHKKAR